MIALENILKGHCSPPDVTFPVIITRTNVRIMETNNQTAISFKGLFILFILNYFSVYNFIFTIGKVFNVIHEIKD